LKLAVLALALTACLDEPANPPGHGYEMRDQVLVTDVDGDGFDDLVTWGHAGDPRVDSQVFVRWGGHVPLNPDPDQVVTIPAKVSRPYHETVVVMQPTLIAHVLFALSCDGNGPGDPQPSRICQLWRLPITGRTFGDPVGLLQDDFNASGFGGYTRNPAPVFVAEYEKTLGDPRMIVGDHDRLLEGPLGGTIADVMFTAPMPFEKPMDIISVPPPAGMMQEELLFVTSAHAGIVASPPIDAGSGVALFDMGDPMTVVTRDIGGPWVVAAPANSTDLTFLHEFNTFELARTEVRVPMPPQQLALGNIGGVSLVDIDPTGLSVYENLDGGTGTFAAVAGPIETESETVLAVGHFDTSSNDSIMVYDGTEQSHAPRCFHVVSGALSGC